MGFFFIRPKLCTVVNYSGDVKSGLKYLDFDWSGFQTVGTIAMTIAKAQPFENRTIQNLTFKKSRFQMVRFQIPTVTGFYKITALLQEQSYILI